MRSCSIWRLKCPAGQCLQSVVIWALPISVTSASPTCLLATNVLSKCHSLAVSLLHCHICATHRHPCVTRCNPCVARCHPCVIRCHPHAPHAAASPLLSFVVTHMTSIAAAPQVLPVVTHIPSMPQHHPRTHPLTPTCLARCSGGCHRCQCSLIVVSGVTIEHRASVRSVTRAELSLTSQLSISLDSRANGFR